MNRDRKALNLDPLEAGPLEGQVRETDTAVRGRVTLELRAEMPDGAPDHVIRTVAENCRTLKFSSSGFEED